MSTNGALNRKLRMALVGGGQGAFIPVFKVYQIRQIILMDIYQIS